MCSSGEGGTRDGTTAGMQVVHVAIVIRMLASALSAVCLLLMSTSMCLVLQGTSPPHQVVHKPSTLGLYVEAH